MYTHTLCILCVSHSLYRLSTSQGEELSSSLLLPPQSHTHITTSPTPHPSQTHSSQSPPHTTLTHSEQKKMKKSTKQLSAAEIAMATNTVAADVDRIAVRAEQELEEVEWNRDTKRVGNRPSYHGNNILPDTADDMGPGEHLLPLQPPSIFLI